MHAIETDTENKLRPPGVGRRKKVWILLLITLFEGRQTQLHTLSGEMDEEKQMGNAMNEIAKSLAKGLGKSMRTQNSKVSS